MITLAGYQISDILYEGSRTEVYRGTRNRNHQPVIIKVLRNPNPNFNELAKFHNQYIITRELEHSSIVQPLALERYGNGYALVMPDRGAIALSGYWQRSQRSLSKFLNISIQLADVLHYLNQQRIIHKDIKPANILIHPDSYQVKLIDFSIASLLPKEQQQLMNPNVLEGTLAYISPEQTGRMNRGIDYRTDFYSLGVTFYELLTGKLPFETDDPMELVHCHLAKMPRIGNGERGTGNGQRATGNGQGERGTGNGQRSRGTGNGERGTGNGQRGTVKGNGERGTGNGQRATGNGQQETNLEQIPQVLSEIVLKLMAKNAEDRYQSALGLKHDLEKCLQHFKEGKIVSFEIGQRDICDRFLIPEKLYGRETEIAKLLAAFERIANPPKSPKGNAGKSEMMLVAGFSGIGKTAVVNEVHKPIVKQRGYFIKGKFDQFNRNIPFSAFVQAFRDLMGQILGESDTKLTNWKTQILQAVGEKGQVLIDVIPELEQILGKQSPVPELSGSAAQNRFNLLFGKFVRVFTTVEHPLVIFLDDLQWADSASLNLLTLLMDESATGYLLVLGAYRDNEVFPAHPLMLTLDRIQKQNAMMTTLTLKPLGEEDISCLIADTLLCAIDLATPLSQLVYQKTQGNPFFTTQFLRGLHEEDCIVFDGTEGYWFCNLTRVRELALTDDLVDFMVGRLQKLPQATQDVLKLAACIGNRFDSGVLAVVCEKPQDQVARELWRALQEGFVIPENEIYKFFQGERPEKKAIEDLRVRYRFLHDRVQQAAYVLIHEQQKEITHLHIGQLLLQNLSPQEQEEQIFETINQLNLGRCAISNPTEKLELAQLNLQAGQKAKLSVAYKAAQNYCELGIELLPATAWESDYSLIYNLHRNASEAAYLCGDFDQAEALYAIALTHVKTPLDRAAIYRVQMTQYQLQGRNAEAIAIQGKSLELLGWSMPKAPEQIQESLNAEIEAIQQFLQQQNVESILEFPKMQDACIAEMLQILQILFYAAWLNGQPILALLALAKMTTLSLEHGNSEMSPFGYVGYGMIAIIALKEYETAHQFGEMAVKLCEQFDNVDIRGMTNFFFAGDVHSWSRPIREAEHYYENGYKYGMEAGNWLTVTFTMMLADSDYLTYGKNLEDLYEIAQTHADFMHRIKSFENLDNYTASVLQPIRHLLGLTTNYLSFDDDTFREADHLQKYSNNLFILAWFYAIKIRHAYLFDLKDTYADLIPKLSIVEKTIATHAKVPSTVFYVALMHMTLIDMTDDPKQRQSHWQEIALLEERLNNWEKACPDNIRHKCLLLQAEKARLHDNKALAIDLYEEAIVHAQAEDYIYEEALANELAAKFYLDWDKEKVARGYLEEAYYAYAHWGSRSKTKQLEENYPQLLAEIFKCSKSSLNPSNLQPFSPTITSIAPVLDLNSAIQASQTVSQEIELDALIFKLMQIVLENAGADKGALILDNSGNWEIVSQCMSDTCQLSKVLVEQTDLLPNSIINKVKRTQETVLLNQVDQDTFFAADPYFIKHQPKSLFCTPILNQRKLIGLLYLENNLAEGVFTSARIEVLNLLISQAAISIENARLYRRLEDYSHNLEIQVERRTEELQEKNQYLQDTLQTLQQTQAHLIQTEKMSSLGKMVAGIAHEINNPISFILGNIDPARGYFKDLLELIDIYKENLSNPNVLIEEKEEEIDLEFLCADLEKMFDSMEYGTDRISNIILGLRNFSRLDEAEYKQVDIHEGLDNTLLILHHRLKSHNPEIAIVKNYAELPRMQCYANQLNQVFLNILSNAIDAFMMSETGQHPQIAIATEMKTPQTVRISIGDNGPGMTENLRQKIFDPFFTTKPVGQGTGLGLSTSYQIITEQHQGQLHCISQPGEGAEFIIEIPIV